MNGRVAKCLLLAEVLSADGMMAEAEKEYLRAAMIRHGLSDSERQEVFDLKGLEQAPGVAATLPLEERRALLDELIDAALIDGKLTAQETDAVKRLTEALGVTDG